MLEQWQCFPSHSFPNYFFLYSHSALYIYWYILSRQIICIEQFFTTLSQLAAPSFASQFPFVSSRSQAFLRFTPTIHSPASLRSYCLTVVFEIKHLLPVILTPISPSVGAAWSAFLFLFIFCLFAISEPLSYFFITIEFTVIYPPGMPTLKRSLCLLLRLFYPVTPYFLYVSYKKFIKTNFLGYTSLANLQSFNWFLVDSKWNAILNI